VIPKILHKYNKANKGQVILLWHQLSQKLIKQLVYQLGIFPNKLLSSLKTRFTQSQ